jgi:hypothetical protein
MLVPVPPRVVAFVRTSSVVLSRGNLLTVRIWSMVTWP